MRIARIFERDARTVLSLDLALQFTSVAPSFQGVKAMTGGAL
jgi:hypothetical protein